MKSPITAHRTDDTSAGDAYWRDLITQMGSDIGLCLSSALERVNALTTTGRIDRAGLRALRDEIDRARRMGMLGQQVARYASGRLRQTPEQLSLTTLMREVLMQRGREAASRGLEIRQSLRPVEVIADATMLHALVQAVADWVLETAQGIVEFRLDMKPWPARAMLTCRFGHAPDHLPAEVVAHTDHMTALDTLAWRLVQQVARTLELVILREDSPQECLLTLEFPRTVTEQLEAVTAVEVETEGFAVSENSKPLAGSHVLVLAARRDLRTDIRDATRHMGLLVDFVGSVDEAEAFCRDALPHAIVYESALAGDRFQRLSREISAEVPQTAFLEIAEEGDELLLSGDGSRHARIGRDAVTASLASALLFELSREG